MLKICNSAYIGKCVFFLFISFAWSPSFIYVSLSPCIKLTYLYSLLSTIYHLPIYLSMHLPFHLSIHHLSFYLCIIYLSIPNVSMYYLCICLSSVYETLLLYIGKHTIVEYSDASENRNKQVDFSFR